MATHPELLAEAARIAMGRPPLAYEPVLAGDSLAHWGYATRGHISFACGVKAGLFLPEERRAVTCPQCLALLAKLVG